MTKRKQSTSKKNTSFKKAMGIDRLIANEKANFTVGLILLVFAIFLIICLCSYFNSCEEDQSLVLSPQPGDLLNQGKFYHNYCGSLGARISHLLIAVLFGVPSFLIPFYLLVCAVRMMGIYKINLWKWFFSIFIIMIWSSITVAKFVNPLFSDLVYNVGGQHGEFVCEFIENIIGPPGLTALLILVALIFLTYLSSETIILIRKIMNPIGYITSRVKFTVSNGTTEVDEAATNVPASADEELVYDNPTTQSVEFDVNGNDAVISDQGYSDDTDASLIDSDNNPKSYDDNSKGYDANSKGYDGETQDVGLEIEQTAEEESADGQVLAEVEHGDMTIYDPKATLSRYKYPTLDLLKKYDNDGKSYIDMEEQRANKDRIVQVLGNFGVTVDSIKATVGPTITLYEITLAPGIKISKVRSLEDDIALSLAALGIRIIAPIPGRGTIGIEVPNANPQIVSMESILNSKKFKESKMALPLALGKTISNEIYMVDLAKIPHLLVAGATGQGKSVGLNAIITSLLYKKHPSELKFVLVDPKMVEFSIYKPLINHFLAQIPPESDADEPIITDVSKVVKTLNSVCQEMDDRYNLLKFANVRKLEEYNEKFVNHQLNPENGHRYLPYIVVIIDEYGDLIMTAGKEIELPIARIAQKARAVGIHMIIATQRPTTNIITGTIKANFPGRMAFKVMSQIDSRTILDGSGANQLIGRGDMLILDKGTPVRVQCAFVDTPEVIAINEFIANQVGYDGPFELPEPVSADEGGGSGSSEDMGNIDQLFVEAARIIVASDQGSTSLIQRKFSIGYNRAGRLMDQLEKAGIVGAAHGSKPREVLVKDENTLQSIFNVLGVG